MQAAWAFQKGALPESAQRWRGTSPRTLWGADGALPNLRASEERLVQEREPGGHRTSVSPRLCCVEAMRGCCWFSLICE